MSKRNNEFCDAAQLIAYEIRNYMGLKSVVDLKWKKSDTCGNFLIEMTAEQCLELSERLLEQAKLMAWSAQQLSADQVKMS